MDLRPEEESAQSGYGQEITVTFQDNVAVIQMSRGENRCNLDMVQRFHKALDIVERSVELSYHAIIHHMQPTQVTIWLHQSIITGISHNRIHGMKNIRIFRVS